MEKKIITISREFGSGGRTVGHMVAERLGIPFYDKELVDQIALESGFAPKFVEENGEHSPGSSLFSYAFAPQGVPGIMNGLSTADFLWNIQCSVILQLAEKGPCVIVGRNADYILKEYDHCLRVFVHADRSWRLLRIRKEMPDTPLSVLESDMDTADRARRAYCEQMTGRTYGDCRNYDLTLCTSSLGMEKAYQLLKEAAEIV